MATQKPSVDWSLRTDPLDGTEHLLKQNPVGAATNGVDEERVTTQLMLNFVLANLPTPISQIQLDDANVTFDPLTSIFTITETNGDIITVPFDPLFKLKQDITVDGVTFTTANTYDDVLIALNDKKVDGFTEGSVLFAAPDGSITEDNDNLFWDDIDNNLIIGDSTDTRNSPQAFGSHSGINLTNPTGTATIDLNSFRDSANGSKVLGFRGWGTQSSIQDIKDKADNYFDPSSNSNGDMLELGGHFLLDKAASGNAKWVAQGGQIKLSIKEKLLGNIKTQFSVNVVDGSEADIATSTMNAEQIVFSRDGLTVTPYGEGIMGATDLSKTDSNLLAGFATDGTIIEISSQRNNGNIAYVSINGDNSTAVVGDPFKAFRDPWSAANYARANPILVDEVYVYAGTYNLQTDYTGQTDNLLIWNNGKVFCESGVLFVSSSITQSPIKTIEAAIKFDLNGFLDLNVDSIGVYIISNYGTINLDINNITCTNLSYGEAFKISGNININFNINDIIAAPTRAVGFFEADNGNTSKSVRNINIKNLKLNGAASDIAFATLELQKMQAGDILNVNIGNIIANVSNVGAPLLLSSNTATGNMDGVFINYSVDNISYENVSGVDYTNEDNISLLNTIASIDTNSAITNSIIIFNIGTMYGEIAAGFRSTNSGSLNNIVTIDVKNIKTTKNHPCYVDTNNAIGNVNFKVIQANSAKDCIRIFRGGSSSDVSTISGVFKNLTAESVVRVVLTGIETKKHVFDNVSLINDASVSAFESVASTTIGIASKNVTTNTLFVHPFLAPSGMPIFRDGSYG